ncbi:MAG TPA: methyltransferase domain-containing protein [Ktedonobacteraceae bacterium]|nr:methyltransferase domain-containing protein [Ktedonobacteraceae bacterium]
MNSTANDENVICICHLRPARRRAVAVATEEILSLLRDLHAEALQGGPLAEQGAVFWIKLPAETLDTAIARLPHLGYTSAVDLLEPSSEQHVPKRAKSHVHAGARTQVQSITSPTPQQVRWHHKTYQLVRIYEEDTQTMREMSPDRRPFLLETSDHVVREIHGYRGDGSTLRRRGLPVYDARMLVNLVVSVENGLFLDPFAGIGGIIIEALARGCTVFSIDIDAALRHGLSKLGAHHQVADASRLPFATGTFDAIATEPPYHEQAHETVLAALSEMTRVLKPGGRLAILSTIEQAQDLRQQINVLGLHLYLDVPIDRKGLDVVVLALQKD